MRALQILLDVLFDATRRTQKGTADFAKVSLSYWAVDEVLVALHLACRGFSNQAYAHIRTAFEMRDKIELFHGAPEWADLWCSGIEQLNAGSDGAPDAADDVSGLRDGPKVSRPGDLWLLGKDCRVYCGSALDASAYAKLMDGERAAVIFADAPYNVKISGNVSGLGALQHREFAMASGEMTEPQFTEFLAKAFSLFARHSVDGSLHFLCMDWRHISEMLAAGGAAYAELMNMCVWVKDNAGMGSLYRSQHELIFVYKNGHGRHSNNVQLGRFGRNRTNIWR